MHSNQDRRVGQQRPMKIQENFVLLVSIDGDKTEFDVVNETKPFCLSL